jgi:hypothetical protein
MQWQNDARRFGQRDLSDVDYALGFWAAVREVCSGKREQRCWFHKIANVLSALPKSAHPGAKKALAEIWNAEDRDHARRAVAAFMLIDGARAAGAPSTHPTSSRSSATAPHSSEANLSNAPPSGAPMPLDQSQHPLFLTISRLDLTLSLLGGESHANAKVSTAAVNELLERHTDKRPLGWESI